MKLGFYKHLKKESQNSFPIESHFLSVRPLSVYRLVGEPWQRVSCALLKDFFLYFFLLTEHRAPLSDLVNQTIYLGWPRPVRYMHRSSLGTQINSHRKIPRSDIIIKMCLKVFRCTLNLYNTRIGSNF